MERLRIEREEWEAEAAKERERREAMEAELTMIERREEEGRREWEKGREELLAERQRADNLQEVLSEFSSGQCLISRPVLFSRLMILQRKMESCGKLLRN